MNKLKSEAIDYGYTWEHMTIISYEDALNRYNNNKHIYLLYEDDTEAMVENVEGCDDVQRIKEHARDLGMFGYEDSMYDFEKTGKLHPERFKS